MDLRYHKSGALCKPCLDFEYQKHHHHRVSWLTPKPERLGTRHVQVFVPSLDRDGNEIPGGHAFWIEETLQTMATLFGGATAFPPSRGAWRDDERGGAILVEDVAIVFSYVAEADLTGAAQPLYEFLMRLGRETRQGEVGIFVDGAYYGFSEFGADPDQGADIHG